MSKFFLRSRRLWAALVPAVVVVAGAYGIESEGLTEELEKLGAAVALLVGSSAGLWSFFRPDNAKLKGKPGALVVLLAAWLTLGCVTVEDDYIRARGMAEGYDVSGPSVTIGADGSVECKSDDPANQPCKARYAAGWEAWPPVLEVLATPFEAVLQLVGRTLADGG